MVEVLVGLARWIVIECLSPGERQTSRGVNLAGKHFCHCRACLKSGIPSLYDRLCIRLHAAKLKRRTVEQHEAHVLVAAREALHQCCLSFREVEALAVTAFGVDTVVDSSHHYHCIGFLGCLAKLCHLPCRSIALGCLYLDAACCISYATRINHAQVIRIALAYLDVGCHHAAAV